MLQKIFTFFFCFYTKRDLDLRQYYQVQNPICGDLNENVPP